MKVGVGEVFIISGQSNAQGLSNQNQNDKVADTPVPTLDAVRVQTDQFDVSKYLVATDATSIGIAQNFNVKKPYLSSLSSGKEAYNNAGSGIAPLGNSLWYWVALGERIAQAYNVPVAFFNAAWGGTNIKAWQQSTNPNASPLGQPTSNGTGNYAPGAPYGLFKNALKFYGSIYGTRGVLWLQGETDAQALRGGTAWERQRINSANEYADNLRAVINQSRLDLKNSKLTWMVGKASYIDGISYDDGSQGAQSAIVVRQGQEQVILSSSTNNPIKRGPDIDQIKGAGERSDNTHLSGDGLRKAAEAWFAAIQSSDLLSSDPIRPARLGTEPQSLQLDANGTIITPLSAGSQYIWYSGSSGHINLNTPAGYGATMPGNVTDPLVIIQDSDGNYTLGALVMPTSQIQAPTTIACSVSNPNGAFDYADCNAISGWALDQADFSKTVTVDIYADGVKVGSTQANGDRQDLVGAFGNNQAARYHGFVYQFPANDTWKNGQNHNITVRICGASDNINGGPKTVSSCGSNGSTQPPTSSTCNYSEGQYLFTFNSEQMYAHYYNGVLYAGYQDGGNFRPQHWLTATGLMNTSTASCFAENDPHATTTTTNPPTSNCNFTEGQYLLTTSWGEVIYAHYYNEILYAALQNGASFKPRSWMEAVGYDASKLSCFAITDPRPSGGRIAASDESDSDKSLELIVSPNPNNGHFAISTSVDLGEIYMLQVTDLMGHVLLKREVVSKGPSSAEQIDLPYSNVARIIVHVKTGLKIAQKTVVIHK